MNDGSLRVQNLYWRNFTSIRGNPLLGTQPPSTNRILEAFHESHDKNLRESTREFLYVPVPLQRVRVIPIEGGKADDCWSYRSSAKILVPLFDDWWRMRADFLLSGNSTEKLLPAIAV